MEQKDLKIGNYYRIKKGCESKCVTFDQILYDGKDPIIRLDKIPPNGCLYYTIIEEQSKNRLGACFSCFRAEDLEEYTESAVNQPDFKENDLVRMKESCVGCVKDQIYSLHWGDASGGDKKTLYAWNETLLNNFSDCSCQDKWEKVSPEFTNCKYSSYIPVTNKLSPISHNPKNIMSDIISFVKNSLLSADEKLLRKYNLHNECSQPTESYKQLVLDKLYADNLAYVVEMATAMEEEEKAKK